VGDSEESEEEDRALSDKGRTYWTFMAVKRTVICGYLSYSSVDNDVVILISFRRIHSIIHPFWKNRYLIIESTFLLSKE